MAGIRDRRPGLSQLPARHPGMDGRAEIPELVRNFVAATSQGFHAAAADQAAHPRAARTGDPVPAGLEARALARTGSDELVSRAASGACSGRPS